MLKTRVITAAVLLAGLLAALFFLPRPGWVVFCSLICALAAWEWGGLAKWSPRARVVYGVISGCLSLCLCLVPDFLRWFELHIANGMLEAAAKSFFEWKLLAEMAVILLLLAALFFWLLVVPLWLWRKWSLQRWSAALVGIIVLIPPTVVFIELQQQPLLLLLVCAPVWMADIAAYFSGRAFGGKKLAPGISPGKTWAGAIGGVIGVLVYGNVVVFTSVSPLGFLMEYGVLLQLVLIVLAVWSIVGDLFESLLKRQAGVKDSSNLLPGHGGVLDRIDSLLPTLTLISFFFLTLLTLIHEH
jgi:phosphatidate cytidylyltransferase